MTPAPVVTPPEPELTPEAIVRRAEAMRPLLRSRQDACEAARQLPPETFADFERAGFFRIIQPRRFGGYEFGLETFVRVMIEISRGCADSGWTLSLTAGHPIFMVKFPEETQREAFGPSGEFRAPGVAMPSGTGVPVDGGYLVKGAWDYASGCDYGTHFLGATVILDPAAQKPRGVMWILVDRKNYSIVDNWHSIGMQGTGSKRVVVEEMFLPERRTLAFLDEQMGMVHDFPGHGAHSNPLYHGRITPLLYCELAAVAVGAARGALDIYEEMMRTKKDPFPPFALRAANPTYLRYFGQAQAWIDVAEATLLKGVADYMQHAEREQRKLSPVTDEEERRLKLMIQHCLRICWDAADLLFRTAGTSATSFPGAKLGRFVRSLQVIRTHPTTQYETSATDVGGLHFGVSPAGHL